MRTRSLRPWLVSGALTVAALVAVELGFRVAAIGEPVPYDAVTELGPLRLSRNRARLSIRVGGRWTAVTMWGGTEGADG